MCLVKTVVEIEVEQKIYFVWLKIMAQFNVMV
jgi:hypothetical protein